MPHFFRGLCVITGTLLFACASELFAATLKTDAPQATSARSPQWLKHFRPLAKEHTIVAVNDLSGPGSSVPNLANTYDMSLFEWNWGGKQSTFNGAGITTNANYPLTEGTAITTNDHLGFAVDYQAHQMMMEVYWVF